MTGLAWLLAWRWWLVGATAFSFLPLAVLAALDLKRGDS